MSQSKVTLSHVSFSPAKNRIALQASPGFMNVLREFVKLDGFFFGTEIFAQGRNWYHLFARDYHVTGEETTKTDKEILLILAFAEINKIWDRFLAVGERQEKSVAKTVPTTIINRVVHKTAAPAQPVQPTRTPVVHQVRKAPAISQPSIVLDWGDKTVKVVVPKKVSPVKEIVEQPARQVSVTAKLQPKTTPLFSLGKGGFRGAVSSPFASVFKVKASKNPFHRK